MAQPSKAADTPESTDPRIVRSRRMLMEALVKLLNQKEFDHISVQEIADEATLNRATFYLHYLDQRPWADGIGYGIEFEKNRVISISVGQR